MSQTPRTEFAQALRAVATERGLDAEVVIEMIKAAIVAAYKRDLREHGGEENEEFEQDAVIDPVTGETRIFEYPVGKPKKKKDVTPPGFGRIAAQTAKQVIHQKIREAEKDSIIEEYSGRVGNLVSGLILRFDGPNVRVDIGRSTEALMPAEERVPNERLSPGQRLTFLLKGIEDGPRGKQIILTRGDPEFVKRLFAREVPEISTGSVEIKTIAREPGVRTKLAVSSIQSGVDPVGSCVGQKGVRVQAVTNELGGERVDIISWTEDPQEFVKSALSPVEVAAVKINEKLKSAVVEVPEDQLSLAIGREGQNVRLASKLTGWKIDVVPTKTTKVKKEPKEKKEKVVKKKVKKTVKKK